MNYRRFFFLLAVSACSIPVVAQNTEIFDSAGNVLLRLEDERLTDAQSHETIFTVRGNIIFKGNSDKQQDIELLVSSENIFSKKKEGKILDASQRTVLFTVRDGGFFYRDKSTYSTEWLVAHYRKNESGGVALYQGAGDTLVCRINESNLSTGKLVAAFYYFSLKNHWDEKMEAVNAEIQKADTLPPVRKTSGTLRKLWNTGLEEFVWDGETLKRKWNSFDYEEWTFDGTTLKRLWYPGQEEMLWDGEVLRRKWFQSNDEFEWNGSTLRRRWGPATDEFIIQGNIIKRTFGNSEKDEWEIDGEIPVPVIMLVVFNLLRK